MEILLLLQSDLVNGVKCALFCGIIAVVLYDIRYPLEELLFGEDENGCVDNDDSEQDDG